MKVLGYILLNRLGSKESSLTLFYGKMREQNAFKRTKGISTRAG